jgi:hypothetical protein
MRIAEAFVGDVDARWTDAACFLDRRH